MWKFRDSNSKAGSYRSFSVRRIYSQPFLELQAQACAWLSVTSLSPGSSLAFLAGDFRECSLLSWEHPSQASQLAVPFLPFRPQLDDILASSTQW